MIDGTARARLKPTTTSLTAGHLLARRSNSDRQQHLPSQPTGLGDHLTVPRRQLLLMAFGDRVFMPAIFRGEFSPKTNICSKCSKISSYLSKNPRLR